MLLSRALCVCISYATYVKAKQKVEVGVTDKVTYGEKGKECYAFKGKASDGRNLG